MNGKEIMSRETFERINQSYHYQHGLSDGDYAKALRHIETIALNHRCVRTPQVGDLVEGAYYDGHHPYKYGLIEKVDEDGTIHICYQPYVPFIWFDEYMDLHLSVSGGPFGHHKTEELELIADEDERLFCDWGHCGACANGAIHFVAPVRRWRIPYVRQSNCYLYLIKSEVYSHDERYKRGNCFIDGGLSVGRIQSFVSFDAFCKYADYLGIKYEKEYEAETIVRYHLSHDFDNRCFTKMEDLPEGAKPIKGYSNGSMCTCYAVTREHDIEFYRPNPNYKEVYDAMKHEEAMRVKKENGWM